MRSDRGNKALLAVIALGIWALATAQLGVTAGDVHASASPTSALQPWLPDDDANSPALTASPKRSATSTRPLRWRVRNVPLFYLENVTYCVPVISIQNLGPSSTNVDLEFFDSSFASKGLMALSIDAGNMKVLVALRTGTNGYTNPFLPNDWIYIPANFTGFAQVHSDDPRIAVAAFLRCDSHPSNVHPTSVSSLPADPVGTTMEYFQAGMPATWTPPMVEVPE